MLRSVCRVGMLVAALGVVPSGALAAPIVINFDSLSELDSVTNQFVGLTVSNATVLTAGSSLNELEFPPRSGSNVIFDDGGPLSILFSDPIYTFAGFFTYLSPLSVSAFDSAGHLLGTASSAFASNLAFSGDPGSTTNELLELSSFAAISRILIAGDAAGGSFVLDDLTFDRAKPVPEPTSLLLLVVGVAAALVARRRLAVRPNCG